MKTKITTLGLLLIGIFSFGQNSDVTITQDTIKRKVTNVEIGSVKIKVTTDEDENGNVIVEDIEEVSTSKEDTVKKKPQVGYCTGGLDYGIGGYAFMPTTDPILQLSQQKLELDYSKSRNLGINLFVGFNLNKNLAIVTGLRYSKMSFRYNNILSINPATEDITLTSLDTNNVALTLLTTPNYQLNVHYLQIPLMLKIQTNNEDLKIGLGVLGGYKIKDLVRNSYQQKNVEIEQKITNVIDPNVFDLALTGRVTYKNVGLYGTASLKDLYADSRKHGIAMPFSVGLTLGWF